MQNGCSTDILNPTLVGYGALGQFHAVELGPSNVSVNAILPGVVQGERMERVTATRAESFGISFDEMREQYLQKISLRRLVTVEDIAAMTLVLASPAARNVSGQAISVEKNVEISEDSRPHARDKRPTKEKTRYSVGL